MIDELITTSLLRNLDYSSIEKITKFCTKLELVDGDILISENDGESFDLFILCAGNVEIVSSEGRASSGEVVLSKRDTEIFGEIGWLLRNKRTATVRCIGEVEAIRINGAMLMQFLEQSPQAGFHVMKNIAILTAKRLSHTNSLLKQILWNFNI